MKMPTALAVSLAIITLTTAIRAADYNAIDEHGVRVFSKVPPVGVHPRVLMSPEDLPAWRARVIQTYRGKTFFAKRYQSKLIDKLVALDPVLSGKALVKAYPHGGPGHNHELLFATLDAVYHQDKEKAVHVCKALANFARVILARQQHSPEWGKIKENIGGVKGLNGIAAGLGHLWFRGGADFPLGYDYLYDHMTPAQRTICRKAISATTKDIVTWGMGFPRGRAVSNWYPYHGELGPMLLAIEGEEGFREDRWKMHKEMIRNWVEVSLYAEGGTNEDGYVGNLAFREGQFSMIAMARRGENLYRLPGMQNYWKWAVLSLVPGEVGGRTVGYSGSCLAPYESSPVLARWAMPGNKYINYYLRQLKGPDYKLNNRWQYAQLSTLFCTNPEDTEALPLSPDKLGLKKTEVFEKLGLFITRSDWSEDAAYLNMLARHDAWYDRHENVDRGRFVFAAQGRRWAIDRPWGKYQKSSDHNLVHIDGQAQAEAKTGRGKAPNARLVAYGDLGEGKTLSYGVMDLKNAYDWLWSHHWKNPGDGWEPEMRSFEDIGWKWKRPGQPEKLHGCDDETSPKFNFQGCNFWRKPNNPVQFCWRTGILVRGPRPYALIVDDVKKDDKERRYDWYMQIPDDVDFEEQTKGVALLTEKQADTGPRRLLVMPLGPGKVEVKQEDYVAGKSRGKESKARRLVFSRTGTEGRFRILLFPCRKDAKPTVSASEDGFSVKLEDREDQWHFKAAPDGRSRISVRRGDEQLEIK